MKTSQKKIILIASWITIFGTAAKSQYLPIAGGNMTGVATGPAFIQTGSVVDMAAGGTVNTDITHYGGGAIGRNFIAYSKLNVGQSLTVDIGTDVIAVNILSFGTYWGSDVRFIPAGFNIDYSNNNSTWTNYVTVTGNTNIRPTYSPGMSARYWRLTITAVQSGQAQCYISGFQLISTGIGPAGGNHWNSAFAKASIFTNTPVGIGTTETNGYQLAVNGKVRAKEIKVETNWSDYVFYNDYHLPHLNEVERYIKANQHLPEVPSAAEVEKNGINLGETNSLLLKKIEELTLYLIEQNKRIGSLEKKLNGKNRMRPSQRSMNK